MVESAAPNMNLVVMPHQEPCRDSGVDSFISNYIISTNSQVMVIRWWSFGIRLQFLVRIGIVTGEFGTNYRHTDFAPVQSKDKRESIRGS